MSTEAFDPTGGVPQPVPFPIAKSVLPNPTAAPCTGHLQHGRAGQSPQGQTLAPGYSRTVLDDCFHCATWATLSISRGSQPPLTHERD
jgi:hypothetical protein